MSSFTIRLGASVIAFAVAVTAIPASAAHADASVSYAAAVPGLAPAGVADKAVYRDQLGNLMSPPSSAETTPPSAMLGCTPGSGRDNPHYSSGDVSGHGWWTKGSCTSATAHVVNCLYEWYTDNSWRQKACSENEKLKPYTGSGQRTVARARCNPTSGLISWRNHVNVDVDGQVDSSEVPYNQANVVCVVY